MAILPALQDSTFEPEDIEQLSAAYEDALRTLELPDRDDPITQIIAERIISLQSGSSKQRKLASAIR
jgi:hypothetical protein